MTFLITWIIATCLVMTAHSLTQPKYVRSHWRPWSDWAFPGRAALWVLLGLIIAFFAPDILNKFLDIISNPVGAVIALAILISLLAWVWRR